MLIVCWRRIDYKMQNVGEMGQTRDVGRAKFVGLRNITACALSVAEMESRKERKMELHLEKVGRHINP
jgi:hypothetical protein